VLTSRPRPSIGICAGSIFVAGILTSAITTVLATMLVTGAAASVAFSGQAGSGLSTLQWLALVGGILVIGRTMLAAFMTQWFVTAFGATVSLGRCFAALLAGYLVNVILAIVMVQQVARGGVANTQGDMTWWLLSPLIGFVVAVLVLHGGGSPNPRSDGGSGVGGYNVPPEAPQSWLGTGDTTR
jgi:hypothetical protein